MKRKRNLLIGHIEEYFSYEEEQLEAILEKRKESQKMISKKEVKAVKFKCEECGRLFDYPLWVWGNAGTLFYRGLPHVCLYCLSKKVKAVENS